MSTFSFAPARAGRSTMRLLILISVLPVLCLLAWAIMISMPGRPFRGPLPPLTSHQEASRAHLAAHVGTLAGEIGERNYLRPTALEAAATYVKSVLTSLGYDVAAQEYVLGGRTFRNLEATLPGQRRAEEIVLVGGHYDSVIGSPGANDNASGTAAVLELARILHAGRFDRSIRFVTFVNEEPPFFHSDRMGSRVYAREAARRGDKIVAMLSLETIGYYSSAPKTQRYPPPFNLVYPDRGDFIGFVGNIASRRLVRRSIAEFRRHTPLPSEGLAAPSWIPGVFWSDHASFWRHGYPAIMITDTAPFRYPFYHSLEDTPDRVDYARMALVVDGLAHTIRVLAGPRGGTD